MKVIIRSAEPQDWRHVQRLNHEVYQDNSQYDEVLIVERPLEHADAIELFKNLTSKGEYGCFLAEVDGDVVGYLAGAEKEMPYRKVRVGEIYHMGVSSEYRSQGIGSQLVDRFKEWCRERGLKRLFVTAYYQSEDARRFYEKQGLLPISINFEGEM